MHLSFRHFLIESDLIFFEQLTGSDVISLANQIAAKVKSHQFQRALLWRGANDQPQIVTVGKGGEESPFDWKGQGGFYRDSTPKVVKNFKMYYRDLLSSFKDSEIVKLEFSGYEWLLMMIGFTQDGEKMAATSISPGLRSSGALGAAADALRQAGFRMFVQKDKKELHSSDKFLSQLSELVRDLSGRNYSRGSASRINLQAKKDLDRLRQEMPQEWLEYVKRKSELLGSSKECYRVLNYGSLPLTLTTGGKKPASEIKPGEPFFYSNADPKVTYHFSQWWTRVPEESYDDQLSKVKAGIVGQGMMFKCNLPVASGPNELPSILYTFDTLPSTVSVHVNEYEVCLEHSTTAGDETKLVCEMVDMGGSSHSNDW